VGRDWRNPTSRVSRHDNTINWALGCAAAFSLLVVIVLIAYLWTL
jgi:hypothetical protein